MYAKDEVFKNYDTLKENALIYADKCLSAGDDLVDDILKKLE